MVTGTTTRLMGSPLTQHSPSRIVQSQACDGFIGRVNPLLGPFPVAKSMEPLFQNFLEWLDVEVSDDDDMVLPITRSIHEVIGMRRDSFSQPGA